MKLRLPSSTALTTRNARSCGRRKGLTEATKIVECPHCHYRFTIKLPVRILRESPKGAGAHYGHKIRKLSPLHKTIIQVIKDHSREYVTQNGSTVKGLTKREISYWIHKQGLKVSGNSISGRLSELRGAGILSVRRVRVRLFDRETMRYRFVSTPIWSISTLEGYA